MGIHDDNFKHNFSQQRVAVDFLRHNLPQKVLAQVNLHTLEIAPNEFIPSKYRSKRRADLVYSVKNKDGTKLYALLHLEAQSTHQKDMALRIWEYHVAIAKAHYKDKVARKLPLILTFVLYHGKSRWTGAKSIAELFMDFELYLEASLRAPFLVNLTEKEVSDLTQQEASAAPQLLMKGQASKDYVAMLDRLYPLMKAYKQIDDVNVDYMCENDARSPDEFLQKFSKFDLETSQRYRVMFATAIKQEHQKGRQEGMLEGRREGMLEGRQEGMLEGRREGIQKGKREGVRLGITKGREAVAKNMLAKAMEIRLIADITGLSLEEIKALTWAAFACLVWLYI